MKKILISALAFSGILFAGEFDHRLISFEANISDSNYKQYLTEAYTDKNWINANRKLDETTEVLIKDRQVLIPKWQEAVSMLKDSASNNIIAAYQGAMIIESGTMGFYSVNKDVHKYIIDNLMVFVEPMLAKDYCYAYVLASKYELRYNFNYKKGFELAEKGIEACSKTKDESINLKSLDTEMRIMYSKLYHLPKKGN